MYVLLYSLRKQVCVRHGHSCSYAQQAINHDNCITESAHFSKIKWKNKNYQTVGTVLKSNRKTKMTTLSEQFYNLIGKS